MKNVKNKYIDTFLSSLTEKDKKIYILNNIYGMLFHMKKFLVLRD